MSASSQPISTLSISTQGPLLALIASSVLWGLIWIPLKFFGDAGFGSVSLLFIAYGSLSAFAVPLLLRQWRSWQRHWPIMLAIFIFGGYANVAFNTSMMYGNVIRGMALFYTLPAWALLGGYFFLGEKITAGRAFAAVGAIVGAWLILGGMAIFVSAPGWMDVLALSSGFAYAMNNLCFRATPTIPVAPKIAMMFGSGMFFSAALLLAGVQGFPQQLSFFMGLLAVGFGLLWILLANVGTQWAVTHMEAGRAAVIIVLELVVAIVSSLFLLNSHLSLLECCGAALILLAAFIEARDQ